MIIRLFPNSQPASMPLSGGHRRLCRLAPASPHVYRRALIYRLGVADGRRPAAVFNTIARALRDARV